MDPSPLKVVGSEIGKPVHIPGQQNIICWKQYQYMHWEPVDGYQ